MQLIGEDYAAIPNDAEAVNYHHWEYVIKEQDFFLRWSPSWHRIRGSAYVIQIGNNSVKIPANYYLMIGDVYGELDWIKVDEIIGREFEAFVMTNTFEEQAWQIESVNVIGYEEDDTSMLPYTKNPVPVIVGDRASVLVSSVDLYNKMGKFIFSDIV